MASKRLIGTSLLALLLLLLTSSFVIAQDDADAAPEAEIVNDEGGPVVVSGEMEYTYVFLTSGVDQPVIFLDDLKGFTERDRVADYIRTPESQVFGTITSDFSTSPVEYTISLPIEPRAAYVDLDQDDDEDTGVQVLAPTFRLNVYGQPVLEERDYLFTFGSWLTYSSVRVSNQAANKYDIIGGQLIVYAPDNEQGFPSGFGEDGNMFTEDDPIVTLPQGYTLVNLDTEPFTFDRSSAPQISLYEPDIFESPDFSDMTYTEGFDALIDLLRVNYAFTELKELDWDALHDEFYPRFEEAESNGDSEAYQLALRDFYWSIPDGHVYAETPAVAYLFGQETGGGLGLSIRELDDGRIIVTYLTESGPAETAGIEMRADVLEINAQPIDDVVSANIPFSSPFSSEHSRRYQQLRYAVRFPIGQDVEITYQNPGDDEPTTTTLTTIEDPDSFSFSSVNRGLTGNEFPVEFRMLDSGYGYVKIYSFSEDFILTADMWEFVIDNLNTNGVKGLIIDMRQNGGGESFLAETMASFFFAEPVVIGNSGFYVPDEGGFVFHPRDVARIVPTPDGERYDGAVAVLVSPACASACELFTYALSLNERAAIVGQYPTDGLGGAVQAVTLPEGLYMQYAFSPGVGANGEINIEGIGVAPTIDVPVDEETLFSEGDPILEAAEAYLDEETAPDITSMGRLTVGDTVSGELAVNARASYIVDVEEGQMLDITVGDENAEFDTVLRVYDEDDNLLTENDDEPGGTVNSAVNDFEAADDMTLVVEVGTFNDEGEGAYELSVSESVPLQIVEQGDIAAGESISDDIEANSRVRFMLDAEAGAMLDIAVGDDAGEVDTVLRLYDADDNMLAENDDIGDTVNSAIEGFEVPDGAVIIEIATYGDTGSGQYTLTVDEAA
ncbi:MAG: hypothetical protein H7175_28485 [Burkholderiales bacterium]|nr:hypothetical protein [Anaerolineae bacterium]